MAANFITHHYNGTRRSLAGSERQQIALEGETDRLAIARKKCRRLQPSPRRKINMRRGA
jgi:hypothetical protein